MRLIDADALIKDIDYSADMGGALGKVVEAVKHYAKFMAQSAPTIEPERKPGRWTMNSDYPDRLICSECDAMFDCWHWESKQMHFCPNCGADMRGGETT